MAGTDDVGRYADAVMRMIKEDQDSGQVPRDVASLDELDDSADIDDYYRRVGLPADRPEAAWLREAVGTEVGHRLSAEHGGPWHVAWHLPGSPPSDIGRGIGYATRAEAEAVGREYRAAHGGSFYIRGRQPDLTSGT